MKHKAWYKGYIELTNGKTELVLSVCANNKEPIAYTACIEELNQAIADYLSNHNLKEKEIKKINLEVEYPTEEEIFFYDLLAETKEVFESKSATRKKHPKENWNFAICDTPIQKGHGLFFGLNWGGKDINQQTVYPPKHKDRNWGFVTNSRPFFKTYLNEDIEDLNYSNLCFFRSPNMGHFVPSDWGLGLPLFQKYVEYVNPKWALMLGKPPEALKEHITNLKTIQVIEKQKSRTVTFKGYTGTLFNKYPFGAVLHPQAHISRETRHKMWSEVVNSFHIVNQK